MSYADPSWPRSSSVVPPGVCLLHGPFAGTFCPTCSTGIALIDMGSKMLAPAPVLPDAPNKEATE
jgi:hypothetical protein